MSQIDLSRPIRSVRERGFQPPWHTVYIYKCDNGHEVRMKARCFRGRRPEPGTGAVMCLQCDFAANYPK